MGQMQLDKDDDLELDDDLEESSGSVESSETQLETSEVTGDDAITESHEDDEEHESDGDARLEDREAIRERRRLERKTRKEEAKRVREEVMALRNANQELLNRLNTIERRGVSADLAKIDEAMGQLNQSYQYYQEQVRLGTEANNGQAVAEATSRMMQIRDKAAELQRVKQAYSQAQNRPPAPDQRLVEHATQWMNKNKWYKSDGSNLDSKVVLAIDTALAEEGYNPTTPTYWEELDARVKRYLPHRATTGYNTSGTGRAVQEGRPKAPVATRSAGPSASGGGFSLSAERVQAIKDAGLWDDPKSRAEAIKGYRAYDQSQQRGAR